MVDLTEQYKKTKSEFDVAISEVLESGIYIKGIQIEKFELNLAQYCDIQHCISCANGTDALQIAMMALDLKPGDEVIIPSFCYIAPAEAAALLGLKPVFVDVDPKTFTLSSKVLEKVITAKTKLIIPVHLFGQCAEMENILSIAKDNKLFVVEDAAQAIGAKYTFSTGKKMMAGTMSDIGITSFFPSKNLGCYGDGGALFSNEERLSKKIRMICNHGQGKKYLHDLIGVNSRLDTLQAAILNVKLKYLNIYTQSRQKAAAFYDDAFNGNPHFHIPLRNPASSHVFHQYTLRLNTHNSQNLIKHLHSKGIPSIIYYPLPIHLQKAYQYLGYRKGDFPVAELLAETVISLPMHTELDEKQLSYIAENTLSFFK
jgi:UDP-2-acetamido-2-deoxy-ribo-hexuluronate aminotransferase